MSRHIWELLFNSLDTLQTKPLPPIRHICDFSRGVLNVRFMRSHPTLAPRPQICLIGGNGFCAVAGESELNRGRGFGDRSWCLLLTREWLGIEGWFDLTILYWSKQKISTLSPKSPQPLFNSNKIQPKTAREENRYPIFVASEQGLDASA